MEQPRDRMHDPEVRRAEFAKLAAWGVAGVKVDFFHSDKQAGIQLYWDILADAAEHRIMVNLHGCTIPRGWRRTWPHLMTMEGVRGAEQYGFDEHFPETAVWHNTILPFTRNVVGPMDYTPVTFSDFLFPHLTTNGHELALAVVFESGLQHYADSVESYRETPPYVQEMLRRHPGRLGRDPVHRRLPRRIRSPGPANRRHLVPGGNQRHERRTTTRTIPRLPHRTSERPARDGRRQR